VTRSFSWVLLSLLLVACSDETLELGPDVDSAGFSAPTAHTAAANLAVLGQAPFENRQDFDDAERGLIARMPNLKISKADGSDIWNQTAYEFMGEEAPDSVNPSLWRQALLNNKHGLYKVTEGIYQLRGHDLANMTLIESDTGWIVVDPLTSRETASTALAFAREQLGDKPVVAVMVTHSHIDHFAGVLGVVSEEEVAQGKVRVIAPEGFMEEATSENVIAGIAMLRRSQFMYGSQLPRSARGHIGSGLGKNPALGTVGILQPTDIVNHDTHELTVDGVTIQFLYAPESEAPAEYMFYLPQYEAFCGAEVVSSNLHNLYTLRGAKVRNALKWSFYINESIDLFDDAEVYFGSHHWPRWGREDVLSFLEIQRDTYKYIHDQTVRLFNAGMTSREIAEELKLPESLTATFSNRDYYGTIRHNSKAVYQGYLGWYDGNPANLNPLPPTAAAERYVEMMGGEIAILEKAQVYFDRGEYRWVAEVLNHLVFAEPGNAAARGLLARSYDQLGYQSESGPWRDVYLSAAYELRHGVATRAVTDLSSARDLMKHTPLPLMFGSMAVRLKGPEADGEKLSIKMVFTDLDESYLLRVENAVLHHREARPGENADAVLTLTHELFLDLALKTAPIQDVLLSDDLSIEGSKLALLKFFSLQDQPDGLFSIVTP
jgi:alkyl sulfatase BDS1-like metallo-beta-lactamase superfamily hydrolase